MPLTPAKLPEFYSPLSEQPDNLYINPDRRYSERSALGFWATDLLRDYVVIAAISPGYRRILLVLGKRDECLGTLPNPWITAAVTAVVDFDRAYSSNLEKVPSTYTAYKNLYAVDSQWIERDCQSSIKLEDSKPKTWPVCLSGVRDKARAYTEALSSLHVQQDQPGDSDYWTVIRRELGALEDLTAACDYQVSRLNFHGVVEGSLKMFLTLLCHLKQHGLMFLGDVPIFVSRRGSVRTPKLLHMYQTLCQKSSKGPGKLPLPERTSGKSREKLQPPKRYGPVTHGQRW